MLVDTYICSKMHLYSRHCYTCVLAGCIYVVIEYDVQLINWFQFTPYLTAYAHAHMNNGALILITLHMQHACRNSHCSRLHKLNILLNALLWPSQQLSTTYLGQAA